MKNVGSGAIEVDGYWSGVNDHGILIIDTCTLSNVVKKENRANEVMEQLKASNWCLFCPAPVMMELGFGRSDRAHPDETEMWKKIFRNNPKANSIYGNETMAVSLQMNQNRRPDIYQGELTFINPDVMNWFAAKNTILTMLDGDPTMSPKTAQGHFMDALILMTARNLFGAVWTDNPKDFIKIQMQGSWEWQRKKSLQPVFCTQDMIDAVDGKTVKFPTENLLGMINDSQIVEELRKLI